MLQNNGSSGGGWATVAENAGHINYFRNRHSVRARPEKRIVGLRAKFMHLAKRLLWALQHIVSSMMEKTARKKNIILNWMRSSEETMSNRRWLTMSAHDSRNNRKLTIFVFFFSCSCSIRVRCLCLYLFVNDRQEMCGSTFCVIVKPCRSAHIYFSPPL